MTRLTGGGTVDIVMPRRSGAEDNTAVATGERGRSKKGVRGNPHTFLHVQCVHSTRAENPMRKHDTTNNDV